MDPRFLAPPPDAPVSPGERPSFSVMIAAYQAAGTIADALESAFAQTVPAHEVIVVDDGSTDDLDSALAPYTGRIRLVRKENGGVASARNAALEVASGDFLVILDADDVYAPGRLEALGGLAIERPDLDVLTTDSYMTLNGKVVRGYYDQGHSFEVERQRERLLSGNFVYPLFAVRRKRAVEVGGFDESLVSVEDWELCLRLVLGGSKVGLVNERLAEYRISASSASADERSMLRSSLQLVDKHWNDPRLTDHERALFERARADFERRLAKEEARAALLENARDARRKSLRVATGSGHGPATRVKALLAAVAPRFAGRHLYGSTAQYLSGGYTVSRD